MVGVVPPAAQPETMRQIRGSPRGLNVAKLNFSDGTTRAPVPGQRVRAMPHAKPLLGHETPPGSPLATTARQTVLLARRALPSPPTKDQSIYAAVARSTIPPSDEAYNAVPPLPLPPQLASNFVPDEELEVEGHGEWWNNRAASVGQVVGQGGEPQQVRESPLTRRIREMLNDVETRIREPKGGILGRGLDRRQVLVNLAEQAANEGFLVTLGQALEQLRGLAEKLEPEDSDVEHDWLLHQTTLTLKADAHHDADMLLAFIDELLSSDEELTDYRRMIGETLSIRQQELRETVYSLPVGSAEAVAAADHCRFIELACVYVDQGRLGALVDVIGDLTQLSKGEEEIGMGAEGNLEPYTAASDIDEIAAYINETVNRWQELQMDMLKENPKIFDRPEEEREEEAVAEPEHDASSEAEAGADIVEVETGEKEYLGFVNVAKKLQSQPGGSRSRRSKPRQHCRLLSGPGGVSRVKQEIAVREQRSIEDLEHLVDTGIDAISIAQKARSAGSTDESDEILLEQQTNETRTADVAPVGQPSAEASLQIVSDAASTNKPTEATPSMVQVLPSAPVLPSLLPSAPTASKQTAGADSLENSTSNGVHVFEFDGENRGSQTARTGGRRSDATSARIGTNNPASSRGVGGVKGWTKATARPSAHQSNAKRRQRKLVARPPRSGAVAGQVAGVEVPQWWLELKATVCGAAVAAAEAAAPNVGIDSGIVLGHRRLRGWATQLYGAGKLDEDALNAAVAWMEEQGGVLTQLSRGAAQAFIHSGVGAAEGQADPDPGPYYRLVLPYGMRTSAITDPNARPVPPATAYRLGRYPSAAAGISATSATGGDPTTAMPISMLSPRLATSGASAAERAGRRAEQQLLRERSARKSESHSLDRAISQVYGTISQRSPRWQHKQTVGFR